MFESSLRKNRLGCSGAPERAALELSPPDGTHPEPHQSAAGWASVGYLAVPTLPG